MSGASKNAVFWDGEGHSMTVPSFLINEAAIAKGIKKVEKIDRKSVV